MEQKEFLEHLRGEIASEIATYRQFEKQREELKLNMRFIAGHIAKSNKLLEAQDQKPVPFEPEAD